MRKLIVLIVFLPSFFGVHLYAELTRTLADALALSLLNNSDINSYSYDMRAADARILQAGFSPNPILDAETENIGAPIFMQTTLMLSQLLELGGKREARLQFAASEREGVAFDYEVKKRQLFVDTTLLFIEVLVNQQKIKFLKENLETLRKFSSNVETRVKAGKASIVEESNFTILLTNALIDVKNAESELKIAKNRLSAQWNEAGAEDFAVAGSLDWIPEIVPLEIMGEAIHQHPLVLRSAIEDTIRSARVRVEKSKAYPDVNLRGGPRYLREANKWVWVVGVSVPLPVNDRNQGRIYESYEYLEKLENEKQAIWTGLLKELNNAYLTIQTVLTELDLLKSVVIPAAQKGYDFSYRGYQLARFNYLELIETERAYRTSKIRYLQALGLYHKTLTVLEGLTGSKAIINKECE